MFEASNELYLQNRKTNQTMHKDKIVNNPPEKSRWLIYYMNLSINLWLALHCCDWKSQSISYRYKLFYDKRNSLEIISLNVRIDVRLKTYSSGSSCQTLVFESRLIPEFFPVYFCYKFDPFMHQNSPSSHCLSNLNFT